MSENQSTPSADIGVVGMAVMGSNLARNLAHKGYSVALFNRTWARTLKVVEEHGTEGSFVPSERIEDFIASIKRPRSIILMVKAGAPTDATIDELLPLLDQGDIIMDGGNSFFQDTRRREERVRAQGIHFVGAGISGGEVGALEGPSIMPGGPEESYRILGPVLERIAASYQGEPCCAWMGPDGAGHFVKMVHNGIEYSDMQVIGEAYELLKGAGLGNDEIADVFATWNEGDLNSYLIEITAEVLRQKDPQTGASLVDVIKDRAQMKGTGTWTVQTALDLGTPVDGIAEAVFARAISSHDELRAAARASLDGPDGTVRVSDREAFIEDVRRALWCSKVVSYAQGLDEIRTGGVQYGWDINVTEVAKIWRAGCIIRAELLEKIRKAFSDDPQLVSLLAAPEVAAELSRYSEAWRRVVCLAASSGVPAPVFSATLAYVDMARAPRVNAALTQGLRDYFGAHSYERVDAPGHYHLEWSTDRTETKVD